MFRHDTTQHEKRITDWKWWLKDKRNFKTRQTVLPLFFIIIPISVWFFSLSIQHDEL